MNEILGNSKYNEISYFDNEVRLTHADVEACAPALSRFPPRVQGAQQGICILMSRGAHYIAAIFAAWRAGFYVVPLNTAWPLQKNLDIIQRIQPAADLLDDDSTLGDPGFSVLRTSDLFANRVDDQLALAETGKPVPIGRSFESKDRVLLVPAANDLAWSVAA